MKYFDLLNRIQRSLQETNGFQHDLLVTDFLAPSKSQNSLIVKEGSDTTEILVCLDEELLNRCSSLRLPYDFQPDMIPDLAILIEELSHFNTFCDRALQDQSVTALELEVQGKVDKFSTILGWLEERNEEILRDRIFDALFDECKVGEWVSEDNRLRYFEAHSIARNFCRKVLRTSPSPEERRVAFKKFFESPRSVKLNPSLD